MSKDMSLDANMKIVQTELPEEEYERLVRVAEREDLSLKDALRDAVKSFTDQQERHDPDDPFFADPPQTDESEGDLTATETDTYLYEQ